MLKSVQRFLLFTLLLISSLFLLYQGFLFWAVRDNLAAGTTIAGLELSGLSLAEARAEIDAHYLSPVAVYHRTDRVEIPVSEIDFTIDYDAMFAAAQSYKDDKPLWQRYLEFLLGQTVDVAEVPLMATHDEAALNDWLQNISGFLDQPARAPQLLIETGTIQQGEPGVITNIDESLPQITAALYRPDNREATLVLEEQSATQFDMSLLEQNINNQLNSFDGAGSIFVLDLQTGEELSINGDMAISGLSILKIAIFLEAFRAIDGPANEYVQGLLEDTAIRSSNYGANLLLHEIAGVNNTYLGAELLTQSMQRLGLVNTFMAIPYDAPVVETRPSTYTTPANSRSDALFIPDPARQTTAEEIGSLLSMIYYCAQGGGTLMALYPGEITPDECQAIIDLMTRNVEGNLIRFGVPEGVPVSHKHGWDGITYGDAGIVYSPGGDYVIVEYVYQNSDWFPAEISFPILREISRATYNYFNIDQPYTGDALTEAGRSIDDIPVGTIPTESGPVEGQ